jgi:hypothetical protein
MLMPHSMSSINCHLTGLSPKLKHSLRGLTISGGFMWCKSTLDCITSLSGLTSLQLLQMKPDGASSVQIDLSVLAKLKHIVKFAMQFPQDPLLQVKFTFEQQEGSGSSSGGSRRNSSGGKRGKKQQKVSLMNDCIKAAGVHYHTGRLLLAYCVTSQPQQLYW